MKYLAILKDSLREAIDTKVFYVMLTVSCLVVLLVGCMSFKPLPAAELKTEFTTMPLNAERSELAKFAGGFGLPFLGSSNFWSQDKIQPADGAPDSPDSPLHFVIHASYGNQAKADKVKKSPEETEEFIKNQFATFGDWRIFEITRVELAQSNAPLQVAFDVYTRPTPATRRIWPCEPSLFFGAVPLSVFKDIPLSVQLYVIEGTLVNGLGAWVAILVSIVITAFFVPNMLRKGTVELLLVKPLHRSTLLLYKYIGGLTFIFLNTAFVVGGVWLMLGWRSGIWATGFLLTILIITLYFAILYSVSTLFGVLTRSPIVSILMTCGAWFIFFVAGQLYVLPDALRNMEDMQKQQERRIAKENNKTDSQGEAPQPARTSEGWWVSMVKAIHFVLPRYSDLSYLTTRLLTNDLLQAKQVDPGQFQTAKFSWGESLTVNAIFIIVMLGLSCLRFALKDY